MLKYTYDAFEKDAKALIEQVREFEPDTIVAIARGGMMLGQIMGYGLDIRNVQSIHIETYDGEQKRENVSIYGRCDLSNSRRVLVVDDIVDTGHTMASLLETFKNGSTGIEVRTAALFYKSSASVLPDFWVHEATEWIDFFWEKVGE